MLRNTLELLRAAVPLITAEYKLLSTKANHSDIASTLCERLDTIFRDRSEEYSVHVDNILAAETELFNEIKDNVQDELVMNNSANYHIDTSENKALYSTGTSTLTYSANDIKYNFDCDGCNISVPFDDSLESTDIIIPNNLD